MSIDLPCAELMHLCEGRCCKLEVCAEARTGDAKLVQWIEGKGGWRLVRAADGYCVHSDPESRTCTIYDARPDDCRAFDCRKDFRIWADFDARVPAPWFAIDAAQD